ncbi:MAG: sigma-54-dependent Fis family transcriptional regulator, partial [Desulfobulbaceae bacterium]|nr:sigma-54-dependent Fis family transcriptional regulator [Desulfobulbaceae bacterium]
GFLDISDRGAIFLDEIAELPISMQVSLLRAIEGYGYTPVGGTEVKKPDVRIIAATNRDLTDEVKQGRMRQDFLYRIHIVPIQIPPLRERKEDIPLLVEHFLGSYDKETVPPLSPKITEALQKYNWPGNVRELQNTLNRFVILKKLDFMGLDLSDQGSGENINGINCDLQDKPLSVLLEEIEKQILLHALGKNTFHLGKTAEALQIDRKTLYRKMKHFNIDRPPSK